LEVKATANDVVSNTWKVLYTSTANEDNGVFLEVVTFTADICPYFVTVRKTHTGDFTKG
jgi:hypothetical protein